MEINVNEERLAGIGVRWAIDLPEGGRLHVIAERSGRRHLAFTASGQSQPEWDLELDQQQAVTIAALLLGARFTVDAADRSGAPDDTVVVKTVELGPAAPVIGCSLAEITLPEADAIVLAIIDDETPDLVERAVERPCEAGDRLVFAARAREVDTIAARLRGEHGSPQPTS